MMLVFYIFALFLLWQSFVSLLGGVRFLRYVESELRRPACEYAPFASVIIPCRGLDEDLVENLRALWRQDYPQYELIFVFDSGSDEARYVAENLAGKNEGKANSVARMRSLIAGQATDSGQKVHNLRAGVDATDARSEVYVFLDTDARPGDSWLRTLVAPLADAHIGAASGYRWFVPPHYGIAPLLRSVWNASITSALGVNTRRNFCWGGSTAIRREVFEKLNVAAAWRGALSDDFALTGALQAAKLPIHFVPRCLLPSYEDCTFRELLEFTTRQVKITRVYAPPLWQIVLWSNLIFTIVFFGGIAISVNSFIAGERFPLSLLLVVSIYLLGGVKAALRLRAVRLALAPRSPGGFVAACAHVLLFPLTAALFLYNALAAAFSRRITWRGIQYELKSARETVIIRGVRQPSTITQRTDAT